MTDWPAGGTLMHPYSLAPDPVDRTQMESGPPKQHNSNGLSLDAFQCQYHFEKADYEIWAAWFRGPDVRRARTFRWRRPDTNALVTARVREGVFKAAPTSATGACMRVSMTIEALT